nr:uncharacterized protein LOC110370405 [Helicoverpa armigera]
MVEYVKLIFSLLLAISAIKCENCVTYDFGSNFYDSFNNGNTLCAGMATWRLGNYSSLELQSPHHDTDLFITPDENLSCVSSYGFEMKSSGILEVYVYMESTSTRDQIVVLANEVAKSGNNVVTGTSILTPLKKDYFDGWHVLRIDLFGTGIFSGYVSFLGVASPGSKVIIDSFRYIPPSFDEDCHVYDGDFVTSSPIETPEQAESEPCVSYNFETEFDVLFNSDRGLCTGFTQWDLNKYSTLPIEQPSSESLKFITPQAEISCISSFPFEVTAGGIVEVNVYMESGSNSDQIAVLVSKIEDEANDVVIGSSVLTPLDGTYTDGWQSLKIQLLGVGTFKAYVSFLGLASEDSIVLVDSFRYISPSIARDECKIYEDDIFETTTSTPVTIAPIGTGKECVTYNFENNFENSFDTNNVLCNGYASWHLGDYHSLTVETLNPESNTFISPNETSSCVSSFVFRMIPGGVVKVNAYLKSASELDYVIVLAKKVVPGGVDTVAGFQMYYASNSNFVEGWNSLEVTVNDFSIFDGYITLIGSTAEESLILIDSFSYTPPDSAYPCEIY